MVVMGTVPNATLRLRTKYNLKNASSAMTLHAISGIPILTEHALCNFLSQALPNIPSPSDILLKALRKRLVDESPKS